jgi:iron complex outermembrane receptor protein
MLWAAVSRALRAPSRNDSNLIVNIGGFTGSDGTLDLVRFFGNPQFKDEELIAYELGFRAAVSKSLTVDLAAYYNDYDHLQSTEPGTPFFESTPLPSHTVLPLIYENLLYGETHGIEISTNWKISDRWMLSPGYAFEQLHMHTDPTSMDVQTVPFIQGGTPHHSAQLRSHFDVRQDLAWEAVSTFADDLKNQGVSTFERIPAYTRLDTGLTWKPTEEISLSAFGQNLLKDYHVEFEDVFGSMQSSEIKRGAFGKITWRF